MHGKQSYNLRPRFVVVAIASLFLAGCVATGTEYVDTADDRGEAVMALDYRDFQQAAGEMVESMLTSGAVVDPDGGRRVLMVGRITNDTMQRIDTDQLLRPIRADLRRSGRVVMTSAVGLQGPEDESSMAVRELRDSEEFDQRTVAGEGQLIAPDSSLSGSILQRVITMDDGSDQVEYYFELALTAVKTGLVLWEDQRLVVKRGSGDTVSW